MSVEAQTPNEMQHQEPTADANAVIENDNVPTSDDDALAAAFDRMTQEDSSQEEQSQRVRDEQGRFVAKQEDPVEGGEGHEDEAAKPSTPAAENSALPSILRGLSQEDVAALPESMRSYLTEKGRQWEAKQNELGQQLASARPILDTISQYRQNFEGLKHPDGRPVSEADAVNYLFSAQQAMNENPLQTLMQFADEFGVVEQLKAALNGQGGSQDSPEGDVTRALLEKIAGLESALARMSDPASIDQRISSKLEQHQETQAVQNTISRFAEQKPLFNEIPEETMAFAINQAWSRLGSEASHEQVLETAYDMSVNMIPELRMKAAAVKPAADTRRVDRQKKANGVNVTSTSTGKDRPLTEDEELAQVWEKVQSQ
jgi:hypothetical protein